jgi:hypothetical protein
VATQTVVVDPSPTVTASSSKTLICSGEKITLSGGGALTYTWSNGVLNGTAFSPPNGTTTYTVSGTAANACTATNTITVLVNTCLAIDNLKPENKISLQIYPNPTADEFNIRSDSPMELSIINELGQLIRTISLNTANNFKTVVSNLPVGIYFVLSQNAAYDIKYKVIVSP